MNKEKYNKAIKAIQNIKLSPSDKAALWERLQSGGGSKVVRPGSIRKEVQRVVRTTILASKMSPKKLHPKK